jgi:hypothetical protein
MFILVADCVWTGPYPEVEPPKAMRRHNSNNLFFKPLELLGSFRKSRSVGIAHRKLRGGAVVVEVGISCVEAQL